MLHHEKAIQQFVDTYRERPGTIGVFWGGSSCERTPEAFSDVDLFVVTEDYVPREAGMSQVYGVTLDYFVNPISRIKQQMEQEIEAIHDYWAIKIYACCLMSMDKHCLYSTKRRNCLIRLFLPRIRTKTSQIIILCLTHFRSTLSIVI